ncbi:MAG TPA: hypothetical protein VHT91_39750 [Kofleriaceae bacterium]|jgi:hypothetical protein|nr:hypothetical protein [Kofleriaceae bacterium]
MTFAAGFELTFTSEPIVEAGCRRGELDPDTPENLAACAALAAAIRANLGDAHAHAIEDDGHGFPRHVITYPDGYWIKVEIDPWCVEVTGRHDTIAGYRAVAPRLERIFAVARGLGLAPHARIGGGHVHVGRASFDDALAVRNFIIDYCNHPELALGILGFDPLNGPALATAPAESLDAFEAGLARLDAGELDLDGFLAHVRDRVYTFAAPELPAHAPRAKYQALNVSHPASLEIRAIRPPHSFDDFVAICELFAARIAFLAGHGPIPYRRERWPGDAPLPEAFARARFFAYCAEARITPRIGLGS